MRNALFQASFPLGDSEKGGGSLKGSPFCSASPRLRFQSIHNRRSSSRPSLRSCFLIGSTNLLSRYLLVTNIAPPTVSTTGTTMVTNKTIRGIAGALWFTTIMASWERFSDLPCAASIRATKDVQPIVDRKIKARHQGSQVSSHTPYRFPVRPLFIHLCGLLKHKWRRVSGLGCQ